MIVRHIFLFIFILSLGTLQAENEIRVKGSEHRIENLEKPKTSNHQTSRLTPCAGPRIKNGMDLNISADFVYWKTRIDTLTYAKTGYAETLTTPEIKKGSVQNVNWSWDPGFKARLGWNFCHGCWDMTLQYTWLYTNVEDTKHSDYLLLPSYDISLTDILLNEINFNHAHAHFDLRYQAGDLELGRNYYVSRSLKLRPFIGIKGTWQTQDYKIYYEDIFIKTVDRFFNFRAKFDQILWGLGMRGGTNSSWQFSKYVGLYGNMALTGMWLHYEIDRKDIFKDKSNLQTHTTKSTTFNIQDHLRLVKPVMEFEIGLRCESYFGCGRYHILIQAGWESQIWINQTLQITKDGHYDRFDLNLHGLATKLRFDF